jgi:hypothetical protein
MEQTRGVYMVGVYSVYYELHLLVGNFKFSIVFPLI